MTDYSQDYDENLNHKGSLLNNMVNEESSIETLLAGITAGNLGRGVFGAFNKTIGIEFNVDKSDQLAILQSRNFVTGSAGWRLDSDGNFEGQSGTFRGVLKTASSGQRITINETANTMIFYDSSGQVIGIGTDAGSAIKLTLTSGTNGGVIVTSSVAGYAFQYTNSTSNLSGNAGISLTLSGTSNTAANLNITNNGTSGAQGALFTITGAAQGINISNTGTGVPIQISTSRSGDVSAGIDITGTVGTSGAANGVQITLSSASGTCTALVLSIAGSGSNSYLFSHAASGMIVSAAIGGNQDKKIRVNIAGAVYFIPLYDA